MPSPEAVRRRRLVVLLPLVVLACRGPQGGSVAVPSEARTSQLTLTHSRGVT